MRGERLQHVRRAIPVALLPALVKRRLDKFWANPEFRQTQEGQMRFLLEHTERAPEIPELAYGYAHHMMMRSYLRWHPGTITREPIRDIEWLTTRRDPERGVILSFMHHNRYDGLWRSLRRAGAPEIHAVMTPDMMSSDAAMAFQQHRRVVALGSTIVPSSGGTDALVAILGPGATLGLASDFPGRTPVTFLGRRVLGSFGAARIATMTDSPVVLVTAHRDDSGASYIQVHKPLEPADYADPADLLEDILVRHGEAVLAWPEALESPRARFAEIEH